VVAAHGLGRVLMPAQESAVERHLASESYIPLSTPRWVSKGKKALESEVERRRNIEVFAIDSRDKRMQGCSQSLE
jgi:hypothetical protein